MNAACTTALAGRDPGGTLRGAPASASNCALESPKGAATGGGFWLSGGKWGGARFAAFPNSHGANTPVTAASRSLETRPPKPHSSPQTFTRMGPSGSQWRVIREPARGSVGRGPALRAAEAEPGLLQPWGHAAPPAAACVLPGTLTEESPRTSSRPRTSSLSGKPHIREKNPQDNGGAKTLPKWVRNE